MDVGTRIADRYVVLGELGAGGMGVVLRARDERLGRLVAVKILPPSTIGDDASRKRLVREARAAAALDHQNIVHVYDVGEMQDGGAFLVMELVRGQSLGEHLRSGTLTINQRLRAVVDVARALQYAHEQGFLHRDIKPDNIMVKVDGRVVVLDFGLAKVVAPGLGTTVEASLISSKSAFVGTPAYVSPEQARGDTLDAKTDQFSLAVSMFELITGELPWEGGTPLEVISHILRGEPKKLRDVSADASAELEAVLDRALKKDVAARFDSIGAFADAVAAAAVPEIDATPSLREVGVGPSQSVHAAAIRTLSAPATSQRVGSRSPRRFRAQLLGGGLVLAATLIGGTYLLTRTPPPPSAPPFVLGTKSTVACPVLATTDPDQTETGWLGAAAATLVCERVTMILGGNPDRTRIPADLLGLAHEPREGFPIQPFDDKNVVEKTVTAAKNADAYIDGTLAHTSDFHVKLAMHAKGGDVLASGEGHGASLLESVRAAMTPLAVHLEPGVDTAYANRWFGGASSSARLSTFDLHVLVLAEDEDNVVAACKSLPRGELGTLAPFATTLCAEKLYEPLPPAPKLDMSSPGAALTTASTLRFTEPATNGERAGWLGELAAREQDLGGKALLFAAEAELEYKALDNKASARSARSSIQASPRIADIRGNAWHRQSFVSEVDNVAVLAAHAAWVPWEPYAWANLLRAKDRRDTRGYQRSYILAQRGYWAVEYGVRLLEIGDLVAARGVAVTTHNARLDVLVLHAERHPGTALTTAIALLRAQEAKPMNGNTATRLAANVIDLGVLLGRPTDDAIADYIERFIIPEPPALSHGVTTLFGTIAVCTQSKPAIGERCIERISTLYERGYFSGAITSAKDGIEGSRHYLKNDFVGAAKAWRSSVSELLAESLRAPMAIAFERAGESSLADHVEAQPVNNETSSPDAELCYVRTALRAEKRGDLATAQKLAHTFVDRWEAVDERPPALTEMKRILARTK